ncbi:uncharacterized protein LOC111373903 [Olea europaea var. sylvestris]|uniref:uncharacterized protein LOC111373903 n=1 Tax=Olea europaea var. sylvestris TaxID=158386 RepID=UPI000C1D2AA9|nr:uncharacterized protein LOC111373903 [Olea europaea var. sylvestris]
MDPITSHTTEVVEPQKKGTTKQRVDALDETTTRLCYALEGLEEKVEMAKSEIRGLHIQLDESQRACAAMTEAAAIIPDLQDEMEALRAQLWVLQRAVGNGYAPVPEYACRLRIPKPCTYGEAHDAKEVENLLFDMERYFLTVSIEDEARKVTAATMYLGGDAKLWWRTKYADIQAHRVRINSWDLFKEAIRLQFFPKNVEDMSEKDKLFTFMEGLKPWTRTKLQRRKQLEVVTDLTDPARTQMGESLTLKIEKELIKAHVAFRETIIIVVKEILTAATVTTGTKEKTSSGVGVSSEVDGECIRQLASGGSSSKQEASQANCHSETDSEEDEDVVGAFSHRCNTLSHRVAEKDDVPLKEAKMEEAKARICRAKGLTYIDVKINGKPIRAMVDTGATHKYLACTEVERLRLVLEKVISRVLSLHKLGGWARREFEDILLEELPKKLSPRKTIDHEIELIPGAKPPARAPYRMSQPELEELRKQLGEMLESGIIVPAKSPYGAPILFQKWPMVLLEYDFVVVYLDNIVIYNETLEEHVQHVRQVFNRLRENELYAKPSKCSFA